jgi:hypothetical protein
MVLAGPVAEYLEGRQHRRAIHHLSYLTYDDRGSIGMSYEWKSTRPKISAHDITDCLAMHVLKLLMQTEPPVALYCLFNGEDYLHQNLI